MKIFLYTLCLVVTFVLTKVHAGQDQESPAILKFEHLRLNVANKEQTAQWYVDQVGLEIIPSSEKDFIYVADKDRNFMLELSSIPDIRNQYFDIHLDSIHLAFEGHKTIEAVAEKMLANQGVQEGSISRNQIGDYVINVRDPNGFVAQLIHRVNPFFSKPLKSTIRFEHVAFNTPDQKVAALWYVEFMDLKLPWSKDIDSTKDNLRNYRVPYVGDASRSMSFELFGKSDIPMVFSSLTHQECHVAFSTDEPEKVAKRMVFGGAKMVGDVQKGPNGNTVVDLRDPIGVPIRLISRKVPLLVPPP